MSLLGQHDPRFIVIYPDGKKSIRMDKSTAEGYRLMFGGEVVCIESKKYNVGCLIYLFLTLAFIALTIVVVTSLAQPISGYP